ncbi:YcaO-like family protein [Streptomyces sp. NPDC051172]
MREDISLPGEKVAKYELHVRRSAAVDKSAWAWQPASRTTGMADVRAFPCDDVRGDIDFMLGRLSEAGIPRVVVVDLSPPQIPVSVVRVIAPRLESWATDYCRIGTRAAHAWRTAVQELLATVPDAAPGTASTTTSSV